MIKKIHIKNFKSLQDISLTCSRFNMLIGPNSSGKSSVFQCLLLVPQAEYEMRGLNGPFVSLGGFRELRNFSSKDNNISISIEYEGIKKPYMISFFDDNKLTEKYRFSGDRDIGLKLHYPSKIKYLSCDRIGSQDIYKKNLGTESVGIKGEYALDVLNQYRNWALPQALCYDKENFTLSYQVNWWLKKIIGARVRTEEIPNTDVLKASFISQNDRSVRPKNIGSGISYLVSIIVMCLFSEKNSILMIENPEIHLHPRAQSELCYFLYFISLADRQVFFETHSDHMFNGVRVGLSENSMAKTDISVNFFNLDENGNTNSTLVDFGRNGRVLNENIGLFDQFDIDINRMLGIKR